MLHYLDIFAFFLKTIRPYFNHRARVFYFGARLGLSLSLLALVFTFSSLSGQDLVLAQTAPAANGTPATNQPPQPSNQAAKGSISGKVVNGTAGAGFGAGSLKDQSVKLQRITGSDNTTVDERDTRLDPAGNFNFQGLDIGENYTYYVSTRYAGVTYYLPQSLILTTAQPVQSAELKVYESTSDRTVVSVVGTSVIVPQVDPDSGQIFILEMYSVVNKGDRTFTGSGPIIAPAPPLASTQANPTPNTTLTATAANSNPANSVTLRFFLPPGAKGISPASGLDPGDIIETTDGLEVTAPVLPGENQLVFSYILPYQSETYSFSKRLAYDTPSFRFFTPVSGPSATSSQLKTGPVMEMGQQKLVPLSGQNFKADAQLKIELTGLPLPSTKGTTALRDNLLKFGTVFISLIGLVFLVVYARDSRKVKTGRAAATSTAASTAPSTSPASPAAHAPGSNSEPVTVGALELERQQLLEAIARLDLNYQKGGFKGKEETYETRRTNFKNRLLEIWDLIPPGPSTDVTPPEPAPVPAPAKSLQPVAAHSDLNGPNRVPVGEEEF